MKITQIRNATMVIHAGKNVILVDPMLAPKGAIPSLKYITQKRRKNPLVDLPQETEAVLKKVTHCLITHCQKGHFDHLDKAGTKWLRTHNIPVYCSAQDAAFLANKGLDVHVLKTNINNDFLGGTINLVPCVHGQGVIGKFMAHGYGFMLELPQQPSLYITGDTILTNEVRNTIESQQPDWIVLPAGGARFDLGGEIIMGKTEALKVAEFAQGNIIANHLESLDHCPVTRLELREAIANSKWQDKFYIPNDGQQLSLS